jgi:hypothetical protein
VALLSSPVTKVFLSLSSKVTVTLTGLMGVGPQSDSSIPLLLERFAVLMWSDSAGMPLDSIDA